MFLGLLLFFYSGWSIGGRGASIGDSLTPLGTCFSSNIFLLDLWTVLRWLNCGVAFAYMSIAMYLSDLVVMIYSAELGSTVIYDWELFETLPPWILDSMG